MIYFCYHKIVIYKIAIYIYKISISCLIIPLRLNLKVKNYYFIGDKENLFKMNV